jgi:AraC-like DNA-binding protein
MLSWGGKRRLVNALFVHYPCRKRRDAYAKNRNALDVRDKNAMGRQYLQTHCHLDTCDLDEARAQVSHLWERHSSALRSGRDYALRWHQADILKASLGFIANSSALRVQSVVGPRYHVTFLLSGGSVHAIQGCEVVASLSEAILHGPGQELELTLDPFEAFVLTFDAETVERALRRRISRLPAPDEWPRTLPLRLPAVATLHSMCRWLGDELDQPDSYLLSTPSARAGLERLLMATFVDALAQVVPSEPRNAGRMGDAQLARLDAWLDANYARSICVEDMARVAGVSVRSLQVTLRRTRGSTPQQAIQRRRLSAVRQMLLADPAITVTQAALDCGCLHLGRMPAAYAAVYGELPSETLARVRAQRGEASPPAVPLIRKVPAAEGMSLIGASPLNHEAATAGALGS